jgi:CubicO group peptidase (beta-lactamase class C family)
VLGAALLLSAPARVADPAELESKLAVTIDRVEKALSLEEAKQALHIPSVSLALIDQDSIAFARAYGENATPNTL